MLSVMFFLKLCVSNKRHDQSLFRTSETLCQRVHGLPSWLHESQAFGFKPWETQDLHYSLEHVVDIYYGLMGIKKYIKLNFYVFTLFLYWDPCKTMSWCCWANRCGVFWFRDHRNALANSSPSEVSLTPVILKLSLVQCVIKKKRIKPRYFHK